MPVIRFELFATSSQFVDEILNILGTISVNLNRAQAQREPHFSEISAVPFGGDHGSKPCSSPKGTALAVPFGGEHGFTNNQLY